MTFEHSHAVAVDCGLHLKQQSLLLDLRRQSSSCVNRHFHADLLWWSLTVTQTLFKSYRSVSFQFCSWSSNWLALHRARILFYSYCL